MRPKTDRLERAMLGPTNTGKTHFALERLCAHSSGMMGFPLRLLAREAYDRIVSEKGAAQVGLITGEERIVPPGARWLLCTVESMPSDRDVSFIALDEAQLGSDPDRGHVFTDRLLHARGREETLILGSSSLNQLIRSLLPEMDILTRPRFSRLTYAGPKKLSRLPPRSVIIAFSAEEVYATAEQVRRHFGGAAIVMGNLSPRTRNAQVDLFQSGEVDYIVATDAVGMGLNLDVNHIAFTSLSKFDGTRKRRLTVSEMAQIAGRAGRYQRDGTFGTVIGLGRAAEFTQEDIDRIEDHRFPALDWLFWRNAGLDYSSPLDLLSSLESSPTTPSLRLSPEADDQAVLRSLMADSDIVELATNERQTMRLWEACGLPDFRGTGPEFHARLVSRLFRHLAVGKGTIPRGMIADDIARLDNVQGNIPTLASRLASVRTWTYIANRKNWLESPQQWADRNREVDNRLSDALHRQLTERFVDRRTTRLARDHRRIKLPSDFHVDAAGTVSVLDEAVGVLSGFRFFPDASVRNDGRKPLLVEAEARLPQEFARRADELSLAPDAAFQLPLNPGEKPALYWRGGPIATLSRGRDLLEPELDLDPSVARLAVPQRQLVLKRVRVYLSHQISDRLMPLQRLNRAAFSPETPPILRATLAPIAVSGGVLLRGAIEAELRTLLPEQRRQLKKLGLVTGSIAIFHPQLLKPDAMRLRLALLAVNTHQPMPPVPLPGLGLLDRPGKELADAALIAGYFPIGDQMIRIDLLERIAVQLHDQRDGGKPFIPDVVLASSIGIGFETLGRLLRVLGFVSVPALESPHQWKWKGLYRRENGRRSFSNRGSPR